MARLRATVLTSAKTCSWRLARLSGPISYLDAVVSPAGDIRIEDEDEVAEAIGRGELSESDKAIINQTRRVLMEEHRRIIQDADVLRSKVIVAKLS